MPRRLCRRGRASGRSIAWAAVAVALLAGWDASGSPVGATAPDPSHALHSAGVATFAIPVWNRGSSASPANLSVRLVINSSALAAYLNANWSNARFAYPNGTAIEAWIEQNASNASLMTTVWARLAAIPANSTATVDLEIYAKSAFLLSAAGPIGENASLSPRYGEWDDGARVFPFYANFSGRGLSPLWSVGPGIAAGVNNGLTVSGASTAGTAIYASGAGSLGGPEAVDFYGQIFSSYPGQDSEALVGQIAPAPPPASGFVWNVLSASNSSIYAISQGTGGTAILNLSSVHANRTWTIEENGSTLGVCLDYRGCEDTTLVNEISGGGYVAAAIFPHPTTTAFTQEIHWIRARVFDPYVSQNWTVSGTLRAARSLDGRGLPLANTSIEVYGAGDGPARAPALGTITTNASGGYNLTEPPGRYWLDPSPVPGFAGGDAMVDLRDAPAALPLTEWPYVPYSNTTYILPGWNNLSSYAANCNMKQPCGSGLGGSQQPLLSWTSDGAFYVNSSGEFVFYSFVNRTVTAIGPWVYLYDNVMAYEGVENTEWLTQDGSYAYEFGCPSACSTSSPIELYALNVTTGQNFSHVFTGVTRAGVALNAQIDLIGLNGNDSLATLIEANGTVVAYDLWNGSQWILGRLPLFEANNVYWIPYLNSFVDCFADGSDQDASMQFMLEPYNGSVRLVGGSNITWGPKTIPIGGVDGTSFNVSSRELAVTYSAVSAYVDATIVYPVNASGWMQRPVRSWNTLGNATYALPSLAASPPTITSSEHRSTLVAGGPSYQYAYDGNFGNDSWAFDFTTGSYQTSNLSIERKGQCPSCYPRGWEQLQAQALEGLFYNTSYGLVPTAYDCRTNLSSCAINGNAGVATGTVWYYHASALPAFPFPATAALAETMPPGATSPIATQLDPAGDAVEISWSPPAAGQDPLVNYTLWWGPVGGTLAPIDLLPSNLSFDFATIPDVTYRFALEAWNLHWASPIESTSFTPYLRLPAPTNVSVANVTASSATVSWTDPDASVTNVTVLYSEAGGSCAALALSAGAKALAATLTGLADGTRYCVRVAAWGSAGEGLESPPVLFETAALPGPVTDLVIEERSPAFAELAWTNPSGGGLVNDSVTLGPGTNCSAAPVSTLSLDGAMDSATVPLDGGGPYFFTVRAWNASGGGPPSACVVSDEPPSIPSGVSAAFVAPGTASVRWTVPYGALGNETVLYGPGSACALDRLVDSVTVPGGSANATVRGLPPSGNFLFAVRALNESGSAVVSGCVVADGYPAAPTGVGARFATDRAIAVAWTDPPGGVTGAVVEYAEGSDCSGADLDQNLTVEGNVSSAELAVPGLSDYLVEVAVENATGPSVASACVELSAPSSPTGTVSARFVSPLAIDVAWSATGAPLTNLTVDLGAGSACALVPFGTAFDVPGTAGSVTLPVASATENYRALVVPWEDGVPLRPLGCAVAAGFPGVPTGLTVVTRSPSSATVAFTNPLGPITGDRVYVAGGTNCSAALSATPLDLAASPPGSAASVRLNGSTADGLVVEVEAVNATGPSLPSACLQLPPAGAPASQPVGPAPPEAALLLAGPSLVAIAALALARRRRTR